MRFFGDWLGDWLGSLFGRTERRPAERGRAFAGEIVSLAPAAELASTAPTVTLHASSSVGVVASSGALGALVTADEAATFDCDKIVAELMSACRSGQLRTLDLESVLTSQSNTGALAVSALSAQVSSAHAEGNIQ